MSDIQTSFDEKLDEIQDRLINDVMDYVSRMQKVGSPVLFLGDYKSESEAAIKQLILDDVIGEDEYSIDPLFAGRQGYWAKNDLRSEQRQVMKGEK